MTSTWYASTRHLDGAAEGDFARPWLKSAGLPWKTTALHIDGSRSSDPRDKSLMSPLLTVSRGRTVRHLRPQSWLDVTFGTARVVFGGERRIGDVGTRDGLVAMKSTRAFSRSQDFGSGRAADVRDCEAGKFQRRNMTRLGIEAGDVSPIDLFLGAPAERWSVRSRRRIFAWEDP